MSISLSIFVNSSLVFVNVYQINLHQINIFSNPWSICHQSQSIIKPLSFWINHLLVLCQLSFINLVFLSNLINFHPYISILDQSVINPLSMQSFCHLWPNQHWSLSINYQVLVSYPFVHNRHHIFIDSIASLPNSFPKSPRVLWFNHLTLLTLPLRLNEFIHLSYVTIELIYLIV